MSLPCLPTVARGYAVLAGRVGAPYMSTWAHKHLDMWVDLVISISDSHWTTADQVHTKGMQMTLSSYGLMRWIDSGSTSVMAMY